ncbi:BrnT family toxin [soil metagenome]
MTPNSHQAFEHIARHRVGPDEAEDAVLDPGRVSFSARRGRIGFIGTTEAGRVLVVILDRKKDLWRVVTARDATPNEKKSYRRRQR